MWLAVLAGRQTADLELLSGDQDPGAGGAVGRAGDEDVSRVDSVLVLRLLRLLRDLSLLVRPAGAGLSLVTAVWLRRRVDLGCRYETDGVYRAFVTLKSRSWRRSRKKLHYHTVNCALAEC